LRDILDENSLLVHLRCRSCAVDNFISLFTLSFLFTVNGKDTDRCELIANALHCIIEQQ
jgi:hypothetical protein